MPCPICNEPAEGERLRIPKGFTPTIDRDKGPILTDRIMCGRLTVNMTWAEIV
jgi:hypothetical protein